MKSAFLLLCGLLGSLMTALGQPAPEVIPTSNGDIKIYPILHSTMVIEYNKQVIYIDPYGGKNAFGAMASPTLILITDIHGDHMNMETLNEVNAQNIRVIAPSAVTTQLPDTFTKLTPLSNGEKISVGSIVIEAIPMYNLPANTSSRHPKGRGNGYLLTIADQRIYISGDTEGVPEMLALSAIDIAFVCMNQPYTMTVEAAADAVLEFQPKVVYPFHYRGKNGYSDIKKFKRLINISSDQIEVRLINWYPNE